MDHLCLDGARTIRRQRVRQLLFLSRSTKPGGRRKPAHMHHACLRLRLRAVVRREKERPCDVRSRSRSATSAMDSCPAGLRGAAVRRYGGRARGAPRAHLPDRAWGRRQGRESVRYACDSPWRVRVGNGARWHLRGAAAPLFYTLSIDQVRVVSARIRRTWPSIDRTVIRKHGPCLSSPRSGLFA